MPESKPLPCYAHAVIHKGVDQTYATCTESGPHSVHTFAWEGNTFHTTEDVRSRSVEIFVGRPLLNMIMDDEVIGHVETFDRAWAWAAGFLKGRGAKVNDGQTIVALDKVTGNYQIYAEGAMVDSGEDFELEKLKRAAEEANRALLKYQKGNTSGKS